MDGFKKFQRYWVKKLLLYNRIEDFSKTFIRSEKMDHLNSIQVLPNQVSKKSFCTFEDIDLREPYAKLHEKQSETVGTD